MAATKYANSVTAEVKGRRSLRQVVRQNVRMLETNLPGLLAVGPCIVTNRMRTYSDSSTSASFEVAL